MITLDMSQGFRPIPVPRDIATCPICGAQICIEEIQEWDVDSGKPLGIAFDCETEPDIDSDEWWDWHNGHWSMPYVYWMPLKERILKWLQRNYRCE